MLRKILIFVSLLAISPLSCYEKPKADSPNFSSGLLCKQEHIAENIETNSDMIHIKGSYCTKVQHNCTKWLDDPKLSYARCKEYTPPAKCIGERINLDFYIDKYELTIPYEDLPTNYQSFNSAVQICESIGKRICTEKEWTFACEGEDMLPYPYGWTREPICNYDKTDLTEIRVVNNKFKAVMIDKREPADYRPECVSPFGVYNMVGNVDEPILVDKNNPPFRNGLKGGWWMAARNRCRPVTIGHDDYYNDIQVGIRCCKDS